MSFCKEDLSQKSYELLELMGTKTPKFASAIDYDRTRSFFLSRHEDAGCEVEGKAASNEDEHSSTESAHEEETPSSTKRPRSSPRKGKHTNASLGRSEGQAR